MNLSANFRPRIRLNFATHIKRAVQGEGKLVVKKGEEIAPDDVLGKYSISAGFSAINISKLLGVSPQEGAKSLQRQIGAKIYKGELLAFKKGLFGRKAVVVAPTDGVIEHYDPLSGDLKLKFIPKEISLTSGVYGIVDEVNEITGEVLIRTMATEVFGVIGSGKERAGVLYIISNKEDLLHPSKITQELSKHILVAGALVYGDTLTKAAGFGIYGIITGGINAKDYKGMTSSIDPRKSIGSDVGISLLVTEGFGPLAIGDDIFNLLRGFNNRYVYLNGNGRTLILPSSSADSILALRKIALPIKRSPASAPEIEIADIKVGSKIRIIWPPYMGVQGKVIVIDETPTVLESGIATYMLTVETAKAKIKVPSPNIELI
ncbi:hypothetical protein HYS93_02145 [Candidatus Daviesbacteria bacterium]|nr:hypothetical protein [Candidatus Daviesbacteria bacterium]